MGLDWKYFILFLLMLQACEATQSTSGKLISYSTESGLIKPEPSYATFHVDEEKTHLYWRVPKSTLLSRKNDQGQDVFSFRFRYGYYSNYSSKIPIDSGNVVVKELPVGFDKDGFVSGRIELKLNAGFNYVVQIALFDLNRNVQDISLVDIMKADALSSDYFEVFDPSDQRLYKDYTLSLGKHRVRNSLSASQLWLRFYGRDFPMAAAPFTTANPKPFDFEPDSLIRLAKDSDSSYAFYVFSSGFYQVVSDTTKREGATVFYYDQFYPKQRTVLDLIQPMRYITTNDEFKTLSSGQALKQNVDEFWLKIGGSPERTRKLIKSYFGRVEYANENFGSYMEGWKTDRGMCYIVFGPPEKVFRTTSAERWVYGENSRNSSLILTFTKVRNPFTNSDFRLNRSTALKTPWYRAVEFWRQGRVVSYR